MKAENCLGSELSIMGCLEALSAYPTYFLVFQVANIYAVHTIKTRYRLHRIEMLMLESWKTRGYLRILFILLVFSVSRNMCFI